MKPQDDEVTPDSELSQDGPEGQPLSSTAPQAAHPQAPGYSSPPPEGPGLPSTANPTVPSQSGSASGATPHDPSNAWKTSEGTHNQMKFQVRHPADWNLYVFPTTAVVTYLKDPNAVVSFMWFHGMGGMDPGTLLSTTLQYNNIQDYEVLSAQPVQIINTPQIIFRQLVQDALFTYRGERCRHHITVIVNDATPPELLFWSGSIIWTQAPASRWEAYRKILDQIESSFKLVQTGQ